MVTGSGLKNKVLEAFALGRAVVSNRMGIESIVGAPPGVHFRLAEKPAEFAEEILSLPEIFRREKTLGTGLKSSSFTLYMGKSNRTIYSISGRTF